MHARANAFELQINSNGIDRRRGEKAAHSSMPHARRLTNELFIRVYSCCFCCCCRFFFFFFFLLPHPPPPLLTFPLHVSCHCTYALPKYAFVLVNTTSVLWTTENNLNFAVHECILWSSDRTTDLRNNVTQTCSYTANVGWCHRMMSNFWVTGWWSTPWWPSRTSPRAWSTIGRTDAW